MSSPITPFTRCCLHCGAMDATIVVTTHDGMSHFVCTDCSMEAWYDEFGRRTEPPAGHQA